jgi:hypothetical protein
VPAFISALIRLVVASFTAATEGFRVMRREPFAVVAWTFVWIGALLLTAVIVATGPRVVVGDAAAGSDLLALVEHFGVRAVLVFPIWIATWAAITTAICRAVFDPDHRAIFHLHLGKAELRIALIYVVTALAAPIVVTPILIGGGLVAKPFFDAAPTMASEIGAVGYLATVCLLSWLFVRLSLITIETFAEGRIHVTAYWPLTRGRFWYLLLAYVFVFLIAFIVVLVVAFVVAFAVGPELLLPATSMSPAAAAASLALKVGVPALLFMMTTVLALSCQAYAYRVIAGGGDGLMAGVDEA